MLEHDRDTIDLDAEVSPDASEVSERFQAMAEELQGVSLERDTEPEIRTCGTPNIGGWPDHRICDRPIYRVGDDYNHFIFWPDTNPQAPSRPAAIAVLMGDRAVCVKRELLTAFARKVLEVFG